MAIGGFNSGFSFFDGFPNVGFSIGGDDPDALSYIAAAGITDTEIKCAANNLFKDCKGVGNTTNNTNFYSGILAMYPMVDTSLSGAAVNAVNPGTYDITLTNFVSGDLNEFGLGDSANASKYGVTGLTAGDITPGNNSMTAYIQTASGGAADDLIGLGSSPFFYVLRDTGAGDVQSFLGAGGTPLEFGSDSGIMTGTRQATSGANAVNAYLNGVLVDTDTTAETTPSSSTAPLELYRLTGTNYYQGRAGFISFGENLTANQAQDYSDAIAKWRASVQTGVCITDIDLAYFILDGNINSSTEASALIDLVAGMKAGTLWSKSYAIYPVSPTSLNAAALDLKGTYPITWNNSPTHAATGVSFNGTTQYGDLGFDTNSLGDDNDFGYTADASIPTPGSPWLNGAGGTTYTGFRNVGGNLLAYNGSNNPTNASPTFDPASGGVFTSNRTSSTSHKLWINGTEYDEITVANSSLPTINEFVGGRNVAGSLSNGGGSNFRTLAYHQGLTDSEVLELHNLINAYNTAVR